MGIALKLAASDRLRIARELLPAVKVDERRGEVTSCCPFHPEKNPSFSYSIEKDVYNCFSCHVSGDLVALWAHVKGLTEKEGFRLFCETYGLDRDAEGRSRDDVRPKDRPEKTTARTKATKAPDLDALFEKLGPLPEELKKDLECQRGWSRTVMERQGLRLQTHYFYKGKIVQAKTPERIAIPIHDAQGRLVNIRFYKRGAAEGKMLSAAPGTGEARLYPALIPVDSGDPVVVCEGEPDVLAALSLGINAVTQTSKKHVWPDGHLEPFRGRDVVVAYDADQPGQGYAATAAASLSRVAKSVRLLQWPDYMGRLDNGTWPAKGGQDLTDFFVRHGKSVEDFKALLAEAQPWTGDPAADPESGEGYEQFFTRGINGRESFKAPLLASKLLLEEPLSWDPSTGLLYRWNTKYFEVYSEDHLRNRAIRYLGTEAQRSRTEDAVYQAKMLCTLPHGRSVNDKTDWLPLQNGMLNMNDYELVPHDRDFLNTYVLPVSFKSTDAEACTQWLRFLCQTVQTPEVIRQVQEFFGYCLTRNADYEKALICLGPGEDGKSKLIHVLREMVGPENCSAVSFPSLENEFHRSSLYNRLVNISTEIGGNYIESPYFKAVTSGDPIDGAFKFQNTFQFTPFCKLVFAGNMLPRVKDTTHGFYRRLLPVRFKRQFKVGDPDRDPQILDKLRPELSDIFTWALAGLMRLKKQKAFTESAETDELLRQYKRTNNPMQCYVEDRLDLEAPPDTETSKDLIYDDYRSYCKVNGYQGIYSRENFFCELYSIKDQLKTSQIYRRIQQNGEVKRERYLVGIAFKPE